MIVHDFAQGSDAWHRARLGVITASRCDTLITAAGKPSTGKGVNSLVYELVAETLIGQPVREVEVDHMTRGSRLESTARAWVAFETGEDVREVGFITTDDGAIGCSPDGILGDACGLELKAPMAHTQVKYADDPTSLLAAYRHQVMLGLFVTGWSDWVLASYSPAPSIPNVLLRVGRDEDYIRALGDAARKAAARVRATIEKMRALCPQDHPFI